MVIFYHESLHFDNFFHERLIRSDKLVNVFDLQRVLVLRERTHEEAISHDQLAADVPVPLLPWRHRVVFGLAVWVEALEVFFRACLGEI